MTPSTNGHNGRDNAGKFLPGNSGGPGNPFASRVGKLRSALISAVTEEDVQAVVKAIVTAAKSGDVAAAKLFFDRVLGKPVVDDVTELDESRNRVLEMLQSQPESASQVIERIRRERAEHAEA